MGQPPKRVKPLQEEHRVKNHNEKNRAMNSWFFPIMGMRMVRFIMTKLVFLVDIFYMNENMLKLAVIDRLNNFFVKEIFMVMPMGGSVEA